MNFSYDKHLQQLQTEDNKKLFNNMFNGSLHAVYLLCSANNNENRQSCINF